MHPNSLIVELFCGSPSHNNLNNKRTAIHVYSWDDSNIVIKKPRVFSKVIPLEEDSTLIDTTRKKLDVDDIKDILPGDCQYVISSAQY